MIDIVGTRLFTEERKVGREGGRHEDCTDSGRGNLWIINATARKSLPLLKQDCSWQRHSGLINILKG